MRSRFFFFNDTATTEIYTLSLHDALPISLYAPLLSISDHACPDRALLPSSLPPGPLRRLGDGTGRSEEHTSELQSRSDLVCRLLLEKKKQHMTDFRRKITQRPRCSLVAPH